MNTLYLIIFHLFIFHIGKEIIFLELIMSDRYLVKEESYEKS